MTNITVKTIPVGPLETNCYLVIDNNTKDALLIDPGAESGELLRIISAIPILSSINNVLGIQTMIPLGYEKYFNTIISVAALFHIILLFILVPNFLATGTVLATIITEGLIMILMYSFIKKKKIPVI